MEKKQVNQECLNSMAISMIMQGRDFNSIKSQLSQEYEVVDNDDLIEQSQNTAPKGAEV